MRRVRVLLYARFARFLKPLTSGFGIASKTQKSRS
jgi:hypothetical protein